MDLGYKRSKVAKNMGIAPRTVSTTLQQVRKKLSAFANNQLQLSSKDAA